ncbi:acyl-CoA dehydrogenase [Nocardioides sp.]|uniref:acyl-CoA dehydrogenase n=1 Tax=Nocardioides sp. TaxID=35761 RepID=UPI0026139EE4|nr:acyl-CoA dehydrogenase [Nocardioides sp.]
MSTTVTGRSGLVEKVRAAGATLAAADAESCAQGRLTDEALAALESTGIFRALQPARWGGGEVGLDEYAEAIIEIGRHSASAGWVASVVGVHPWQIALFDEQAQEEIWGADPARRVASSYTPTGTIEKVEGGFQVSGRWSFSSGSGVADGVILGGIAGTREINGTEYPDFVSVILDADQYRIEQAWNVAGLGGTGSNDIVVEGTFVPEHRAQSHLFYTHGLGTPLPGQAKNDGALYRTPWAVVFNLIIAAGAVGAALGFYDQWVAETRTRRTNYGVMLREEHLVQNHLAEAAWKIDAAILKIKRTGAELMEYAERGELPTPEQRAFWRWDVAKAANVAVDAVQSLMRVSSGRSAFIDHPLQSKFQDVMAASSHAFLFDDVLAKAWGGRHLGAEKLEAVHL